MRLQVHQRIREHDTAVIRIRSRNVDWFRQFSAGAPVLITYWSSNLRERKGTFVGYVTHVRLVTDEDNAYVRDIVCVAASRDLRATAQRTYTNMTSSEIVSEIGRALQFNVITKQHGLRRSTVVQAGETYWEFLNRLAKRTGYVLRVRGTTIFFLPLADMVAHNLSRAPMLSDYAPDPLSLYREPSIEHIDSWVGESSEDAERLSDEAVFVSVSPSTGEIAYVSKRPQSTIQRDRRSRSPYVRYMSAGQAAHSRTDAELLAQGAADNGALALDVAVVAGGNPLLSPYMPVELNIRDRSLSGYWVVKEATHTIIRDDTTTYTCDVVISTDSIDGKTRYPRVQNPELRNFATDILNGFTSTEERDSRLIARREGFVFGVPYDRNALGRWVYAQ